jgi:hypothetical protein
MKLLINSDVDGLSRTIRKGYYKAGFANYIHKKMAEQPTQS